MEASKPSWNENLNPRGTYYEGFVEDLDTLLTRFKAETVTTYGIRKSRYVDSNGDRIREPEADQENTKVIIMNHNTINHVMSCYLVCYLV